MRYILFAIIGLVSFPLFAQQLPVHGPSDEQIEVMALHNQTVARQERALGPVGYRSADVKHFYEWDKTGYLVTSDDDFYGMAEDIKTTIAQNLPQDVTLIVYTQSSNKSYHKQLETFYTQYIGLDRLKILQIPTSGSNDFWSRDNTPVPVWVDGKFSLVDAKYYYNFEPDSFFNQLFGTTMDSHNYFYEGGNMAANGKGDCILVNRKKKYPGGSSDTAAIPDDIFKTKYGCKNIIRFKHLKGIGHTDEVVKFMSDSVVVTDTEEYVETLELAGFTVHLLPEPDLAYETYVNSLQVNDVLFVPIFGESKDQKAIDIYKAINPNLKIVPINSRDIATQGQGGIHCITMNYPPAALSVVVDAFRAQQAN